MENTYTKYIGVSLLWYDIALAVVFCNKNHNNNHPSMMLIIRHVFYKEQNWAIKVISLICNMVIVIIAVVVITIIITVTIFIICNRENGHGLHSYVWKPLQNIICVDETTTKSIYIMVMMIITMYIPYSHLLIDFR